MQGWVWNVFPVGNDGSSSELFRWAIQCQKSQWDCWKRRTVWPSLTIQTSSSWSRLISFHSKPLDRWLQWNGWLVDRWLNIFASKFGFIFSLNLVMFGNIGCRETRAFHHFSLQTLSVQQRNSRKRFCFIPVILRLKHELFAVDLMSWPKKKLINDGIPKSNFVNTALQNRFTKYSIFAKRSREWLSQFSPIYATFPIIQAWGNPFLCQLS